MVLELENSAQATLVEDMVRPMVISKRPSNKFPMLLIRSCDASKSAADIAAEIYENNFKDVIP